jgi:16S rRNA (uracil1498-N3)-methyltransferase
MHRVFVDDFNIKKEQNNIVVAGTDFEHLKKVLRVKIGEEIIACDKNKNDYLCEVSSVHKDFLEMNILSNTKNQSEKSYEITLCQAMPKGNKIELVLQKAVELGVDHISVFYAQRCDVVYDKDKEEKKLKRYEKIVYEAAKQCNRGILPDVEIYQSFTDMFNALDKNNLIIMAYEEERNHTLRQALQNTVKSLCFIVGPEGGFEQKEVEHAKKSGAKIVSLGSRILRTETAGLFILSCCVYERELG